MIILSANNLNKSYGTDVILDGVSFSVNAGDRIGIVGRNGAGKTTLLNMLSGEMEPTSGEYYVSKELKIGYLKQRDNFFRGDTLFGAIDAIFSEIHQVERELDEVTTRIDNGETSLADRLDYLHNRFETLGGYTYKSEIVGVLNAMNFTKHDYDKMIFELSGGEKTRLALAALLLEKPDILLLDEPTNHLDIETLRWLEQYLSAYRGTILIVSHDRYFLDKTVNRIIEVDNNKTTAYAGNYSFYAKERAVRRESQLRAYNNQQREIRRQEDMIRIMKEHNTEHLVKRAQSREKRLEMIDRIEKPESELGKMKIHFKQNFKSGNDVLLCENLSKTLYDRKPYRELFRNVNIDIKRGERICIVGPNGTGKTTLLRMILGELEPTEGRIKIGTNVAFGYYDQGQQLLNDNLTVIEELREAYHLYTDTEMRSILGRFLFKGEDVFLKVGSLSGGEKARLTLVKLILSGANTLILDEPTNHLDIESKEVFEEALLEFPGTAIIVSHDRYFLQKIPTRMLEMHNDGVVEFLGNYDYYMERAQQKIDEEASGSKSGRTIRPKAGQAIESKAGQDPESKTGQTLESKEGWGAELKTGQVTPANSQEERQLKKQQEAQERRLKREIEKVENEIAELEDKISELEAKLTDPEYMSNYEKLSEISTELDNAKKSLDEAFERWAELSEQ